MEHVVFFPSPDGTPGFRRTRTVEDAVRLVEHLRNVEGIDEVSVHALTEVKLSFRAYYRVEVPGGSTPAQGDAARPAAAPEPPVLTLVEPPAAEQAHGDARESLAPESSAPESSAPESPAPAAEHGEPAATDRHGSAAHEPTAHEPSAHEPTGYEPTGYEPTAHEPTGYEPVAHEPTAHEPTGYEPVAQQTEPAAPEPDDQLEPAHQDAQAEQTGQDEQSYQGRQADQVGDERVAQDRLDEADEADEAGESVELDREPKATLVQLATAPDLSGSVAEQVQHVAEAHQGADRADTAGLAEPVHPVAAPLEAEQYFPAAALIASTVEPAQPTAVITSARVESSLIEGLEAFRAVPEPSLPEPSLPEPSVPVPSVSTEEPPALEPLTLGPLLLQPEHDEHPTPVRVSLEPVQLAPVEVPQLAPAPEQAQAHVEPEQEQVEQEHQPEPVAEAEPFPAPAPAPAPAPRSPFPPTVLPEQSAPADQPSERRHARRLSPSSLGFFS